MEIQKWQDIQQILPTTAQPLPHALYAGTDELGNYFMQFQVNSYLKISMDAVLAIVNRTSSHLLVDYNAMKFYREIYVFYYNHSVVSLDHAPLIDFGSVLSNIQTINDWLISTSFYRDENDFTITYANGIDTCLRSIPEVEYHTLLKHAFAK